MAEQLTKSAVEQMIHDRPVGGPGLEVEYEMDDYAYSDALDTNDFPEVNAATAPVAEEAAPVAEVTTDWKALYDAQQAELARYRGEQSERKQADFERRKNELSGDERAEFVENYYKEQERSSQMEAIRSQQAQSHPLTTMLVAPMLEHFEIEIDDPANYARVMDSMETSMTALWQSMVDEGVKREMSKFYAETGQQWGAGKLGDAQPRPLQPRNPIRNQYEAQRAEAIKPGASKTVDQLTSLVRARQAAKDGR